MAEAQIKSDSKVKRKQRRSRAFHIALADNFSLTVSKRKDRPYVGVYKNTSKGRRRGVSIPAELWGAVTGTNDMVQLAVSMLQGTMMVVNNNNNAEAQRNGFTYEQVPAEAQPITLPHLSEQCQE